MISARPAFRHSSALFFGLVAFSWVGQASAQLSVTTTNDADALAASLITNADITVTSAIFSGAATSAGTFVMGPLGISDGILLTTGDATDSLPPNASMETGVPHGTMGNALCTAIAGSETFDASLLQIEFTLATGVDGIALEYIFGTEEYPEYVGQVFNDVVGIFLDGVNIGTDISSDPITVNGPFFSSTEVITDTETEYDGSTPLIQRSSTATGVGATHTLEIVICDNGDALLDSGVFISSLSGCTGDSCATNNYCGDGDLLAPGEQCDDDNNVSGDGCNQECQREDNWECTSVDGEASVCDCSTGYVLAADLSGCAVDTDEDGVEDGDAADPVDNCRDIPNPGQEDADNDGIGDLCDTDEPTEPGVRYGIQGGGCNFAAKGQGSPAFPLLLALAVLIGVLGRRRLARGIVLALVFAGLSGGGLQDAQAQLEISSDFPAERFRLSTDAQGILGLEWAGIPTHLSIGTGFWLGYADDPLTFYRLGDDQRERVDSLVGSRVGAGLVGSVSLFDLVQLGIEVPLILSQASDISNDVLMTNSLSSYGLGDLRLVPKLGLLHEKRHGIALSVAAGVTLATSTEDDFFGESTTSFAPELLVGKSFDQGLRVGANVGYRIRKQSVALDLEVDDEVYGILGAAYSLEASGGPPLEFNATFSLATAANDLGAAFNRNYSEAKLGASYGIGPITVFAAAGAGTSEGFGTPDWRALSGLRFRGAEREESTPAPIVAAPEPEPDTDGDGFVDAVDKCPLQAENVNSFEDEDGCPDELPDTDKDGILDRDDRCPKEAEDMDQFEDEDGCPDLDNDKDGVLDVEDECPIVPGVAVTKGCPDPDRDSDTVVDRIDNCPDVPGSPENFGCVKRQLVQITGSKLELLEVVYFRTNKAVIRNISFELLDNVAAVLIAQANIANIRVEGHTDDRAKDAYNKKLSQNRANAVVDYLVNKGVAKERLQAVGFGEERPLKDNKSKEGRAANRRVEFVIVDPEAEGIEMKQNAPTVDTIDE